MNKKYWFYGAALLVSFAFGRWSGPEKIKIETKTVEVEKKSSTKDTDLEKNKRKETTVTEKTNPDGSKETVTHTIEEVSSAAKKSESDSSESERAKNETKEIEKSPSKTTVSVLAGTSFTTPKIVYGGSVYRNVIGPVGIGVWGLTDKTVGANVGLSF